MKLEDNQERRFSALENLSHIQMTIPTDLQAQLANLSDDQRARVVAIVRRHIAACRRQGCTLAAPAIILKEAIDLIVMEDASGQSGAVEPARIDAGLQRRYEVYIEPVHW